MWFVFYIVDLLNFGLTHDDFFSFNYFLSLSFYFENAISLLSLSLSSLLFLSVYHCVCPSPSLLTPASLPQATGYILYLTLKVERLPFEKFRSNLFLTINSRKFSLYTSI
jgi:hypothetical protein